MTAAENQTLEEAIGRALGRTVPMGLAATLMPHVDSIIAEVINAVGEWIHDTTKEEDS